jgi:hypothetical protein
MPGRFLSDSYLAEIRGRAAAGRSPWAPAYAKLQAAGEEGLRQEPLSIRQNGQSAYFKEDASYVANKDGVLDPKGNFESRRLAIQLSRVCLDLALAWRMTAEARYADKALGLIHTWCINRNTYMFPTGCVVAAATPGAPANGDITIFGAFHDLFLAGYLLGDYAGWGVHPHAAVKRWVRDMIAPQREAMFFEGREMYNNWEDARLLYLAKGALMLDDLDLLTHVFDRWVHILPLKMTDEGELPRETMRTRSMHYTLFALDSMTRVAEIARQHGVDLYETSVNGKCLRKAIDYAAHYLLHRNEWPFQMIEPLEGDRSSLNHLGIFEMAYARWGDKKYLDVIAAWGGRPVAPAHATLLYGRE